MESLRFFSTGGGSNVSLSGTTLTIGDETHTLADPDTVSQNATAIDTKSTVTLSGTTLTIDGVATTLADPDTVSQHTTDIATNTSDIASKSTVSLSGNTLTIDETDHTLADPARDDVSFNSSTLRSKIQGVWERIGNISTGMSHLVLNQISFNSTGDVVAFGSYNHNGNSIVEVYEYQSNSWTQKGSILDSSQTAEKCVSLSADGLTLLTTNPNDNSNTGIAKIYKFVSGSWTQLGSDIAGENANDYLGIRASISKSGKKVLIVTWNSFITYNLNEVTNDWETYGSEITFPGFNITLGLVDFTGDVVAVHVNGQVKIYRYDNGWIETGSISHNGNDISLNSSGTIIALGHSIHSTGYVEVYQYHLDQWQQLGDTIEGAVGDDFGQSVSLSADGLVLTVGAMQGSVAANGYTKIFQYNAGNWNQISDTIVGPSAYSGSSVAMNGDGKSFAVFSYVNGFIHIYKLYSNTLNDLTDVDTSAPTSGQGLVYDTSVNQWVPQNLVSTLNGLTDVDTSGASSGQALMYNASNQWVPQNIINPNALNDLTDVNTSGASSGQALVYNASNQWVPQNIINPNALNDLTDVNTSGASSGQALVYDSLLQIWQPGSVSNELSDLTNVSTTAPTDGQALVYDSSANQWQPDSLIVANPSSTPTADLTKLTVGSTTYDIPGNVRNYQYEVITATNVYSTTGHSTGTNPTWTDVTDVSISITPLRTDSPMRIQAHFFGEVSTHDGDLKFRFKRVQGGTTTYVKHSNDLRGTLSVVGHDSSGIGTTQQPWQIIAFDSNASSGQITYTLQIADHGGGIFYLNRTQSTTNTADRELLNSTIEVEEIMTGPPLQVNSNVVPINPTNGHFIQWNGSAYTTALPILALNDLTNVSTTAPSNGDLLKWSGTAWVGQNPLLTGQSFGVKLGQRSGLSSGAWGNNSTWIHMYILRADFAQAGGFSQYRNQITFPNGVTQHMDNNAGTITLPYDGYYVYHGNFSQRTGQVRIAFAVYALISGSYTQVGPSHFPQNDLGSQGGCHIFSWCMFFPAGSQIRLYINGMIHKASNPATIHNQFNIHYIGANAGTHVYGTV